MRRKWNQILALLLSLALCVSLFPVSAVSETVTVSSAQDLFKLSKSCALDSYSKGLTVELQADLDLSGYGFTPIPIFCGVFHGNGHTIRFQFTGKGSNQGFFRYLEADALIEDLNLDADLQPDGSKSVVGGLAGQNKGTIRGCTVTGTVTGDVDVGGLTGVNLEGGNVEHCTNKAAISGNTHTGGITGRNEGVLLGCTNEGAVNTSIMESASLVDKTLTVPEEIDESEEPTDKALDGSSTDTGGIAGRSTGTIDGCSNRGDVGYPHTGYNVGGVAGIQNGNVIRATNEGAVFGRKDIGGIVGQFEPYGTITYGQDPKENLNHALSVLSGLLNQLTDQAGGVTDDAVEDVAAVNGTMGGIRDTVKDAGDDGKADVQAAIDTVHAAAQDINVAFDGLLSDTDQFSTIMNADLDLMTKDLKAVRQGLQDALDSGDAGISDGISQVNTRIDHIDSDANAIRNSVSHISDYLTLFSNFATASIVIASGIYAADKVPSLDTPNPGGGDLKNLRKLTTRLADLETLSDAFNNRYNHYKANNGGRDIGGEIKNIGTQISNMTSELRQLQRDISDLYGSASDDIREALEGSNDAADHLEQAFRHLNDAAKSFSDSATSALDVANARVDTIEDTVKDWSDTFHDKSQTFSDDVNQQLADINDRIQEMADGAAAANSDIHSTTRRIVRQMDEVRSALSQLTDTPEKTVSDISDSAEDEGTTGRVITCRNSGPVEGDSNVGGIAGTVAPEISLDPEQDLDIDTGKVLVDTTATVKATIRDCTGLGPITVKNSCAGGIAGRCEVGAVLDCVSRCTVTSKGGGQCGGVAGLSRSVIRRCATQCDLTGDDKLGGIAGQGHDIRDCRAMTRILESDGEKLGAVAGSADGSISGNYFLDEGLAGLDGVNYEGKALPLDFESFSALSGVPADFLSFSITFQADDQTVAVLPATYGGRLDPSSFPAVPEKDGQYGDWEEFEYGRVLRSATVNAVYSGWVTTISSGGERPAMLADGAFSPDATLVLQEWTPDPNTVPSGYQLVAAYQYNVTDSLDLPAQVTLRLSTEGAPGKPAAALLQGNALDPVAATADGSYLVLTSAPSGSIVLLAQEQAPLAPLLAGGGAALLLLLALLLFHKHRKTKKKQPAIVGEQQK